MKYLVTFPNGDTRKVAADSVYEAAQIMRVNGFVIEGAKIQHDRCKKCKEICVCGGDRL